MKANKIIYLFTSIAFFTFLIHCSSENINYEIREENGISFVTNINAKYKVNEKFNLEFVRTFGELEGEDENQQFFIPGDFTVDNNGNIYILDTGNQRVQVFSLQGKFLQTIGREGQGPGEFMNPASLEIFEDRLYVHEDSRKKIQVLSLKGDYIDEFKVDAWYNNFRMLDTDNLVFSKLRGVSKRDTGNDPDNKAAESLIHLMNVSDNTVRKVGEPFKYGEITANILNNAAVFTVDKEKNIYIAFENENSIQKYDNSGKMLLSISRALPFEKILPKYKTLPNGFTVEDGTKMSEDIGIDYSGNIWVVSYTRQIKEEEMVRMGKTIDRGGKITTELYGGTDILQTDLFKLEVFSKEGILLQEIPMNHFCNKMRIFGDRLFILDRLRGMNLREYRIIN
ncbi:6-bladed beta-propeller [candidate division KSB1 bacterium]